MEKRVGLLSLIACLSLLIIPIASAEIFVSQPHFLYNLGDELKANVTVNADSDITDFLSVKLLCGSLSISNNTNSSENATIETIDNQVEIYKNTLSVIKNQAKSLEISTKIDRSLIGELVGNCYLSASFNDESQESQVFEISEKLLIDYNIRGTLFNPGESIIISGKVKKENGKQSIGFIEARIEQIGLEVYGKVDNGVFETTLTIPQNAKSGNHDLTIRAYEKDSKGEITNEGETRTVFKVNPIPKELDIAISNQEVIPGEEFTYTPLLYDQADEKITKEVSLKIYNPSAQIALEKVIRSGEAQTVTFPTNSSPGYWNIKAVSGAIENTQIFYMKEKPKISVELKDRMLFIKNIGNVPYSNPLEVYIGDTPRVKELNLELGESKEFRLEAPEGQYSIEVTANGNRSALGTAFLTGSAISLESIGGLFDGMYIPIIVSFIIILILAAIAIFLYRKVRKKTQYATQPANVLYKELPKISATQSSKPTPQQIINKQTPQGSGKKQEATVINLKLKSLQQLEKSAFKPAALGIIDRALGKVKYSGAKIYVSNENRIIVFTKILTGETDNSLRGIEIAQEMRRILAKYNEKALEKISFGIGVNLGDMIIEKNADGSVKFTSIGNVVGIAKRISELSSNDVLISESLHRRLAGKIKTIAIPEKRVWKLSESSAQARQEEFIKRFAEKRRARAEQKRF